MSSPGARAIIDDYLFCERRGMLRVRDIMTRSIWSLRASASLEDAALALVAHGVGGAPVVNDDGRVLGILSRADLADPERCANAPAGDERPDGCPRIGDLMLPAVAVLRDSEPAIEAARRMTREHLHRLLVTDEVGRLVGIVTATDVLRAAAPGVRPYRVADTDRDDPEGALH